MSISKLSKKLTKGTVRSLVITLVIAALLFIVGPTPAQAVTPSITPATAYSGGAATFFVTVDIHSYEQIPIDGIKVCVTQNNTARTWVTFDAAGYWVAESADATSWTTSLYSSDAPGSYCYGYGYGYGWSDAYFTPSTGGYTYGYIPCAGYGYMGTMPWKSFGYKYGYGYGYTGYWDGSGYTYYPTPVSLVYRVTLTTSGMAVGYYDVRVDVDAGNDVDGNEIHYLSSIQTLSVLTAAVGGGGGAAPGPGIDEGSVDDSNVTSDSADISWTTYRPGTSQVRYRASPWVYSTLDSTLVTKHLVHLTNLKPDTTYEYQCLSKDAAGNLSTSATHTFKTLGAPPAPPAPAPAAFEVSKLSITPTEVEPGEKVTISAEVSNTGGTEGAYTTELKINDKTEATKKVTVAAGASKLVSFSVSRDEPGTYKVALDGLSGEFVVAKLVPPVVPPPVVPPGPNWALIGGIIGGVIVVFLLVYFLWWRRRAA